MHIAKIAIDMPAYSSNLFSPSAYYRFLLALASIIEPSLSVELGLCTGAGSLYLALGYPQGRVIGVDSVAEYPKHIRHVKSVCPNFEFWLMDSVRSATKVSELGLMVDILFIDTIHTYDQVVGEFGAYESLLTEGAVVLFDDLNYAGVRRAFVEAAPGREHVDLGFLYPNCEDYGLGAIIM